MSAGPYFAFVNAVRAAPPKTASTPDGLLTANGKLLLLVLASFAKYDDPALRSWPSVEALAEATALSKATLHRVFPEVAGWVRITRRGRDKSNAYELHVPAAARSEPSPAVPHAVEPSTHERGRQVPQRLKSHPETSSGMKSQPATSSGDEVSSCDVAACDVATGDGRSLIQAVMKSHPETRSPQDLLTGSPQEREPAPGNESKEEIGATAFVEVKPVRSVRKKPTTHCPGAEESVEALDAWCRGQKIPPASQVPEVLKFVRWHQKTGTPRASWLAAWQDWLARAGIDATLVQGSTPARETPEQAAARVMARSEGNGRNPNPVTPRFELHPHDEARIAAARADQEQAGRARVAQSRPQGEPTSAFSIFRNGAGGGQ